MTEKTGITAADDQLKTYEEQLDDVAARAMAGRINRRTFEREMDEISTDNTLTMFLIGGGDPENARAQEWLRRQREIHLKSIKQLANDIFGGRYTTKDG